MGCKERNKGQRQQSGMNYSQRLPSKKRAHNAFDFLKYKQTFSICVCVCVLYIVLPNNYKTHSRYGSRYRLPRYLFLNLHTPFFPLITFFHHISFASILEMKFALVLQPDRVLQAKKRTECTFIVVSNVKHFYIHHFVMIQPFEMH